MPSHAHTVNKQPMLASAARTTSGQSNGHRLHGFIQGNWLINVSAASGTGRKLVVYAQHSWDDSTYYNVGDSINITATGQYNLACDNFGKYLRLKYTITGISASFTFSVDFMGKD